MQSGESSYRRYLNGDKSGFDDVMSIYYADLIRFITRYSKSETDAEDIAADTFLELLVHPGRYSFKSSLKTYIFSVARHKAISARRKSGRYTDIDLSSLPNNTSPSDDPDGALMLSQTKDAVGSALSKINAEYAEVLYLKFYEGLDGDDIARVMKKNKRQVANLIYRAKDALRAELERSGFSHEEYR